MLEYTDIQLKLDLYVTEANLDLNMQSGMLIAVPIPRETAAEANSIQCAIDQAVAEAKYVIK
jgi:pseudouridine-5'-phosphate glycosidase